MDRLVLIFLTVAFTLLCYVESSLTVEQKTVLPRVDDELRLPRSVLPSLYTIRLLPFIEEGNFSIDGYMEVEVECMEATDLIIMNSAEIEVPLTSLKIEDLATNTSLSATGFVLDERRERITISLDRMLVLGTRYRISMKFTATLNDKLRGFYRSSYVEDGVTKYLAVSQMEESDARRAFPCFDEPDMKAQFAVTLGRKDSMRSRSNMPQRESKPIDGLAGYTWDIYETSPKMSTYLIAFMVSEFTVTQSDPSLSKPVFSILSRNKVADQTKYAGDVGPKVLTFYEKYWNIEFPLPKQDMAAIPDFGPGAMENWGLVTYREDMFLVNELRSSAADKQLATEVIAHELAHQWFGNLVTMTWWNSLWLNEGFARYMQYVGVNEVKPEYMINEQFGLNALHIALAADSLESSSPLNPPVNPSSEISSNSAITYNKGASLIRMLANIVGSETFNRGLTNYLNAKAYGNAEQDDLWSAIDKQAAVEGVILPVSVKKIMESWTLKKNYPLIRITRDYGNSDGATATQERFLLRKPNESNDTTIYQWWIHLTHSTDFNAPTATAWMSEDTSTKRLESLGARDDQWVIFNVNQMGYYRVAYDATNYRLIRDQLQSDHAKILSLNRGQLLDDSLNLARAGALPYDTALSLTVYLAKERDYAPWHSALTSLAYLDNMLQINSSAYQLWTDYMTSLINPLYEYVKFDDNDGDAHLLILLRVDAIAWACKYGNVDCITRSKAEYAAWMNAPQTEELSPNQKLGVSCAAIANGGEAEWQFALDAYIRSKESSQENYLLEAMACSKDPALLSRTLEMTINSTSGIRLQDADSLFGYVADNPVGNRLAFEFLRDKFDEIKAYFEGYVSMGSFFKTVSTNFNTEEQRKELEQLRVDHEDVLAGSAQVQQALENVMSNILWVESYYDEVLGWLVNGSSTTIPTESTHVSTEESTTKAPTESTHVSTEESTTKAPTETTRVSTEENTTRTQTESTPVITEIPSTSPTSATIRIRPMIALLLAIVLVNLLV